MAESSPLERLRLIMARLRDPETGCAWDRAQTAGTIVPFTLEEAYELADVIARDQGSAEDGRELCSELGDLLFQVVFQAQIGEEAGRFDLDDVARAIGDKLVRRHPHVFAGVEHADAAARESAWEAEKARERAARAQVSAMDDIPLALPALARAAKTQRRAARLGFDWNDPAPVLEKIHEELAEAQKALDQGEEPARVSEEVGDVLFAVSNWARHLGVEPEAALRASTRKFEARFRVMEALATARGETLDTLEWEVQEALYQEARRRERVTPDRGLDQGRNMTHAVELPEHFLPARIETVEQVTPQIKVFTLQADPQRFRSKPGQWLDLAIPQDNGESFVGGYSLVSAPRTDGRLQLAIKYADHHQATHHLHSVAQEGDIVYITPGQGNFFFEPGMAQKVVLLGAGIGVTPLLGILRAIHADMPDVYAHLVYSVAHQDEVLFPEELRTMAQAPNLDVSLTVTREAEDWLGHTGRISHELLESLELPRDALFYFCGSREFIEDMATLLREWGIPEARLIYEKWW